MAVPVRKPPSPSDSQDPRATEYFFKDLHDQNKRTGTVTMDLASIAPGGKATITIPVNGALAGKQQTVEYGLPETWNTDLDITGAFVSADDTVSLVVKNRTAGAIDMGSATYSARVRP
jgi:hypothetical protein